MRFENQSVELKLRDYKKTNLIFAIKKLCAPIELETATYLVKKNTICLTMYKKENNHWPQLAYKEDAVILIIIIDQIKEGRKGC